MWADMKNRLPGFASKRIAAGAAGVVASQVVADPNIVWYTLALIGSQTLIDCAKAWRNGS